MQGINVVVIGGNVTRDPELKYTPSGTAVLNISVAINRKYKSGDEVKEDVAFIPVVIWNKQAENCAQYLHKGSAVMVEGRLQSRTYEPQEGQKRTVIEVVASHVQFMGQKGAGGQPEAQEEAPESTGES